MGNLTSRCTLNTSDVTRKPRNLRISMRDATKANNNCSMSDATKAQLQQLITSLETCSSALAAREAAAAKLRTTPGMRLPPLRCVEPLGTLLRLIQSTQNTREQKEAIGAVIRNVAGATPLLLELYTYQASRALTLEALLWLSSDAFDGRGAGLFRDKLRNAHAIEDLCSFVYLSPTARSGGLCADGAPTLRRIVYFSLATLANLIATTEHCRRMARVVPRLRELATPYAAAAAPFGTSTTTITYTQRGPSHQERSWSALLCPLTHRLLLPPPLCAAQARPDRPQPPVQLGGRRRRHRGGARPDQVPPHPIGP